MTANPETTTAIIIPFRDRGTDPCRQANLDRVLHHWGLFPAPVIVAGDGREGDAQFNRSAAYNRGAAQTDADILIYTESDMLIHYDQIDQAIKLAAERPGLVVPFTHQDKLSAADSEQVRALRIAPTKCSPATSLSNNYGCINVISRDTLAAVGQWDETFHGNAHDDAAMWIAFDIVAGVTRWIQGPAYHLYHRESVGTHTSLADKTATEHNHRRMQVYLQARTPEEIRHLTAGGQTLSRNWRGQLQ